MNDRLIYCSITGFNLKKFMFYFTGHLCLFKATELMVLIPEGQVMI